MTKRIGFCCKWLDHPSQIDGFKPKDDAKRFNNQTTTVAWLKRQTTSVAEQRLYDIMVHNTDALLRLVNRVGELDEPLRMVRLGSDVLPVYTEPNFGYFWNDTSLRREIETRLKRVGEAARTHNVRLSFHPGQFCVLASDRPDVVESSIAEFEYHTDLARWMGYGLSWHSEGFKINVHISGRLGAAGIRTVLDRLSPEARNLITIENEENSYGIDSALELADRLAIVLDVHHHWCREGVFLSRSDDRTKRIIDSWRGVRPTMHYSLPREQLAAGLDPEVNLDHQALMESGVKKQFMRAHSDYMWNNRVNDYVREFWEDFDIQVESKAKNLASTKLYEYLTK
jgi:UV DNA damage repair endonuclease